MRHCGGHDVDLLGLGCISVISTVIHSAPRLQKVPLKQICTDLGAVCSDYNGSESTGHYI